MSPAPAPAAPGAVYRGSAAGKVILLGEHAVVYGSRALVVGLDAGAEADARRAPRSELELGAVRYTLSGSTQASEALPARAFRALLAALGASDVAAAARLAIPAGAGLGASAALGVALGRAVSQLVAATGAPPPAIAPAALAWEHVFHGNASGVDTAAAEHAGCLSFRRGDPPQRLQPARPLELVVALVESGARTRQMVEGLAARRAAERARVDAQLNEIAELVVRAQRCIELGELRELGQHMTKNHELLAALGVSTPALDRAVRVALDAGALGAKLTGAGGGGCAVALSDGASGAALLERWQGLGLRCWQKRVG